MVAQELVLDREVRDWVLIPLTALMVLMQLLRQYVSQVGPPPARWGRLQSAYCAQGGQGSR